MQIKITPEDILKRGLWDYYTYYIIGNEKESQELLKNNKEFIISEKDAIVIGLLKVMETDNLIHRFNDYLIYVLIDLQLLLLQENHLFYLFHQKI